MVAMSAGSSNPMCSKQAEYEPKTSSPYEAWAGYEEDEDEGFALSVGELRSVARRQLVGSIAVVAVIAAIAGVVALQPTQRDGQYASARNFPIVQKPVVLTSTEHLAATVNRAAEVP
jgi:hypothetical protein